MDESGGNQFEGVSATVRKKRSQMVRRPRPEPASFPESHEQSPLTPYSDDDAKISSDDNVGDSNAGGKMFNLNQCISRGSSAASVEGEYSFKKIKEDGSSSKSYVNERVEDNTHSRQGASNRRLGNVWDSEGNDSKLKKVKLKVGGATCTIQTKTGYYGPSGSRLSTKSPQPLDAFRPQQKENSSEDGSPIEKKSGFQGISRKDFPGSTFAVGKDDTGKMPMKNTFEKQGDKSDPIRKSKRMQKRLALDGYDEDDEDDEIRYLEKLKTSKIAGYKDFEEESTRKRSLFRVSKVSKYEEEEDVGRLDKDVKKRSDQCSEGTDFEGEELFSDGELEGKKKQKHKVSSDSLIEWRREITLTTRQRALLSSKDSSASSVNQIEFPNGLPPPPPRKPKEKLSEVEQQLKKVEAAQRRRMQNEKAARESEAEAIRKILGQDSNRKKREEKIKKRQEELAQEKAAKEQLLASSTIRIIMGPAGTVVTFPPDMSFPHIFDSKPCCYPPPREKCAGPSCVNPYKYRDSKSNLPLCSLQCYKAIRERGLYIILDLVNLMAVLNWPDLLLFTQTIYASCLLISSAEMDAHSVSTEAKEQLQI